jgi:predicted aminopeptidase
MAVAGLVAVTVAGTLCLSGCANLGYYWQAMAGQLNIMTAARPIEKWLEDDQSPEKLKARLALTQRIRQYAVAELKEPDNPSYHRYADLHRSAVVWNVAAAPAYSVTLKEWCFPVTGCVSYRGYFDQQQARAEATELAAEGYESNAYPVPAYSTLGWMNWAGGDPLLNTFIYYPEGELARLIFHELAHQIVYAKNDTTFNESFATSVERMGSARWLATHASEAARKEYAEFDARRNQFHALALATRKHLEEIYKTARGAKRDALKQAAMKQFREQYAQLRASWGGDPARYRGYDNWVEHANNASFGAQAAYDDLEPEFEALFVRQGRDWKRFYDEVKRLAALPKNERHQLLKDEVAQAGHGAG